MSEEAKNFDYELLTVIVDSGLGSKVLHTAYCNGVLGGTIVHGVGFVKNKLLRFLDLNETRREVVMMVTNKTISAKLLPILEEKLELNKLYQGIAFSTNVTSFFGSYKSQPNIIINRKESDRMYNVIYTVIEKGFGEDVIETAMNAGSKGGTIINGRGSGVHETCKLFSIEIEPEKEIVIIISKKDKTEGIVASIREKLKLDEPGNGIIFVQEIDQIYGVC